MKWTLRERFLLYIWVFPITWPAERSSTCRHANRCEEVRSASDLSNRISSYVFVRRQGHRNRLCLVFDRLCLVFDRICLRGRAIRSHRSVRTCEDIRGDAIRDAMSHGWSHKPTDFFNLLLHRTDSYRKRWQPYEQVRRGAIDRSSSYVFASTRRLPYMGMSGARNRTGKADRTRFSHVFHLFSARCDLSKRSSMIARRSPADRFSSHVRVRPRIEMRLLGDFWRSIASRRRQPMRSTVWSPWHWRTSRCDWDPTESPVEAPYKWLDI
jgi:hypothetical protein